MRELRPGLWHWQAPHPEWESTEPWDQNVSSLALRYGAGVEEETTSPAEACAVPEVAAREPRVLGRLPWA